MSAHRIARDEALADRYLHDPATASVIPTDKDDLVVGWSTGASGEVATLPAPNQAGKNLTLHLIAHGGGDMVVTPTGGGQKTDGTALATITFDTALDTIVLKSVPTATAGTYKSRAIVNQGCTLG